MTTCHVMRCTSTAKNHYAKFGTTFCGRHGRALGIKPPATRGRFQPFQRTPRANRHG